MLKPTIFIVEDEGVVAQNIQEMLEQFGYSVSGSASTGESALEEMAKAPPDLALIDIRLKGKIDGIETAQKLHESSPIPVVYMTAYADQHTLQRAKETEPLGYLVKPFDARELGAVVEVALHKAKIERTLRESAERYRQLFESNPQPMWVYDVDSLAFLAVNDAAVAHYGYTLADFLTMTIADIHPAEDVPALREFLKQGLPKLSAPRLWRHGKKDGRIIDVEICTHDITWAGRAARLASATDITERKRLEDQYRQAQKMEAVGQLAGGVAHDFNNLLTIISGYSDLLLTDTGLDDSTKELVREIHKASDRAASLTRQLLAFSRRQVVELRVLEMNLVITNVESMLRRMIGEDIELTTVLDPAVGQIKADQGQIEQIIFNLAINARDAMEHGGKVTIELTNAELDANYARTHPEVLPGEYVLLAVSDTGCGMSQATQSRIFEPFFTTKSPGKGTGLGLATVYGIVKQSGGHIAVYSELGQGATFKVYLPKVLEKPAKTRSQSGPANLAGGTETILVVEDEDAVRALTRHILQSSGYAILEARNGAEGIALAAQHKGPLDLLVTDVVMPQVGGRPLAEALLSRHPKLKVLYLSGYTTDAVIRHGVLEAETAFLHKPFTPRALLQKVREVLDG
ncbi:MAG TPA: response regulator [Gemmataceae bacterium]|nr:response regulator [Gemmataceae bacterium]